MNEYLITFKEVVVHQFNVKGNSKEEAVNNFKNLLNDAELDFSAGESVDSDITNVKKL